MEHIGIIGFGEVGRIFAAGLMAAGVSRVSAWDRQFTDPAVAAQAPAAGVQAADGSVCWNPLDEIRLGTEYAVGDVQNLVTLIVDPNGKGLDSHWQKTAVALLVGVILHALTVWFHW